MKSKQKFMVVSSLIILSGVVMIAAVKSNAPLTDKNSAKEDCCKKENRLALAKPSETVILNKEGQRPDDKGCVFKTVFGEESADSNFIYKTPAKVAYSVDDALVWIAKAQSKDGGWGAGSHARQDITDPHAVQSDPASTAMVAMALLRSGHTPTHGKYSNNLNRALNYLMNEVEQSSANSLNITLQTGTQPQMKLGQNIDVVLTSQFLTNVLDYLDQNSSLKNRVMKCNQKCISKIQRAQNSNGSLQGAGWAGVLQSSFATNALETAKDKGVKVDEEALDNAREYQKSNYDVKSNNVTTEDAAGVVLYSISSTSRASAKEARTAREQIEEAKKNGKLEKNASVTIDNLKKAGMSEPEAMKYGTAYEINQAAKIQAQRDDVMNGFGSNGGEEFLSYLQTGEGLIMSKDTEWKNWYDNISGRLVRIQNNDGSWSGHHCITSPVFCTATSLLILSVNNDVQRLMASGAKR